MTCFFGRHGFLKVVVIVIQCHAWLGQIECSLFFNYRMSSLSCTVTARFLSSLQSKTLKSIVHTLEGMGSTLVLQLASTQTSQLAMAFVCSICHQFASPTFGRVFRHVGNVHAFEYNFSVICGISGCEAKFKKLSMWRSHIYRKHRQELGFKSDNQQVFYS